jgi:hypothetical protein
MSTRQFVLSTSPDTAGAALMSTRLEPLLPEVDHLLPVQGCRGAERHIPCKESPHVVF